MSLTVHSRQSLLLSFFLFLASSSFVRSLLNFDCVAFSPVRVFRLISLCTAVAKCLLILLPPLFSFDKSMAAAIISAIIRN